MNLLLLGGNSPSNKIWIGRIAEVLRPLFTSVHTQQYDHWSTGTEQINFATELTAAEYAVHGWDEYVVFAKSAGSLLALKGIREGRLTPTKCVFIGIAIGWGRKLSLPIDTWLENLSTPTLFIQKTLDPACSFEELQVLLKERHAQHYSLKEISGSDHQYDDIDTLRRAVKEFVFPQ
jgi:hypothetical protein